MPYRAVVPSSLSSRPTTVHVQCEITEIGTTLAYPPDLTAAVDHLDTCLVELRLQQKVPEMARDVWLLRHINPRGKECFDAITK